MLRIYSLCMLVTCIVITCASIIVEDKASRRLGYLLGVVLTLPVIYYIWVT